MTIQTKLLNMYLFIYSKTTLPVITLFFITTMSLRLVLPLASRSLIHWDVCVFDYNLIKLNSTILCCFYITVTLT